MDAIVYEPTNKQGAAAHTYLEEAPAQLATYLDEFKCDNTLVEGGPLVIECKGCLSDGSA